MRIQSLRGNFGRSLNLLIVAVAPTFGFQSLQSVVQTEHFSAVDDARNLVPFVRAVVVGGQDPYFAAGSRPASFPCVRWLATRPVRTGLISLAALALAAHDPCGHATNLAWNGEREGTSDHLARSISEHGRP